MYASHFDGDDDHHVSSGGVAVVVTSAFSEQLDEVVPEELVKGRLLVLNLKKGNTRAQVVAVYGTTGEGGPEGRRLLWEELRGAIRPSDRSLLFLAGGLPPGGECSPESRGGGGWGGHP